MSYFTKILKRNQLSSHDGRPLWQYNLTKIDFEDLKEYIKTTSLYSLNDKDASIYYAEWWKHEYAGGFPSKERIFDSLNKKYLYSDDHQWFYRKAKHGGTSLGITWIKGQNTQYFRSLLLQGGLPIKQIEANGGVFLKFLEIILKLQPECIEDFSLSESIVSILPPSSRNDNIYDICFKVVSHIINQDKGAIEKLRETSPGIAKIIDHLLTVKLIPKDRLAKSQNLWILNTKNNKASIYLKIGLRPSYSAQNLGNLLEQELNKDNYQLFIDDNLICKFNRMLSGKYKTNIFPHKRLEWQEKGTYPTVSVYTEDDAWDLKNFIHTLPSLKKPSLWAKTGENAWRYIKGNNYSGTEATILYTPDWACKQTSSSIDLFEEPFKWCQFEGEIQLIKDEDIRSYLSGVTAYEWIIESDKPNWLKRSNMTVVRGIPRITLFNEEGAIIPNTEAKIFYKRESEDSSEWISSNDIKTISLGVNRVKIQVGDVISYDSFYNIEMLTIDLIKNSLQSTELIVRNLEEFTFELKTSDQVSSELASRNTYKLRVKSEFSKVPTSIRAKVSYGNQRKLIFEIDAPFEGLALIDKDGSIVVPQSKISWSDLTGMRVLSKKGDKDSTSIIFTSQLRPQIIIRSKLNKNIQPLLSYRDEIQRLFSLSNIMQYDNIVTCQLASDSHYSQYNISNFDLTIEPNPVDKYTVEIPGNNNSLTLQAIPLNCTTDEIRLIELSKELKPKLGYIELNSFSELVSKTIGEEYIYTIPNDSMLSEVIVCSSIENELRIMPRYFNLNADPGGPTKDERISEYHSKYEKPGFVDDIWSELLSYFNICNQNDLPFSTLDQITAISRSSRVAAKAFFHLGLNYTDLEEYIQIIIPKLERDLGFDFHWIYLNDWEYGLGETSEHWGSDYHQYYIKLISNYLSNCGLRKLLLYMNKVKVLFDSPLQHSDLMNIRQNLGEKVMSELPKKGIPRIADNYHIPIEKNKTIKLLLHSPVSVAESILNRNIDHPIFGGDDRSSTVRRNIQYAKYLNPNLYKRIILQVLHKLKK